MGDELSGGGSGSATEGDAAEEAATQAAEDADVAESNA